jgi:hypothetical protein
MSYNLMAEVEGGVDWASLHALAMRRSAYVEYFPILEEAGVPGALGISLPKRSATEEGWAELQDVLRALIREGHASIIDMYSGSAVREPDIHALRRQVLGI